MQPRLGPTARYNPRQTQRRSSPVSERAVFRVLAFGSAADVLGWRQRELELSGELTVRGLLDLLAAECPRIGQARDRLAVAINEQYAQPDDAIGPGDEVAIIPPVSGGQGEPAIAVHITREPIDAAALLTAVNRPEHGAIAVFVGIVRAEVSPTGGALEALEYDAYASMARREIEQICREVSERFGVGAIRVVHRVGRMRIGEASVVIAVGSGHRDEAFAACREIIEQIKHRAPIFKRECWSEGEPTWVRGIDRDQS